MRECKFCGISYREGYADGACSERCWHEYISDCYAEHEGLFPSPRRSCSKGKMLTEPSLIIQVNIKIGFADLGGSISFLRIEDKYFMVEQTHNGPFWKEISKKFFQAAEHEFGRAKPIIDESDQELVEEIKGDMQ